MAGAIDIETYGSRVCPRKKSGIAHVQGHGPYTFEVVFRVPVVPGLFAAMVRHKEMVTHVCCGDEAAVHKHLRQDIVRVWADGARGQPVPPAEPGRLRRKGWLAMKYLGIIPIDALRQTISLVAGRCLFYLLRPFQLGS